MHHKFDHVEFRIPEVWDRVYTVRADDGKILSYKVCGQLGCDEHEFATIEEVQDHLTRKVGVVVYRARRSMNPHDNMGLHDIAKAIRFLPTE